MKNFDDRISDNFREWDSIAWGKESKDTNISRLGSVKKLGKVLEH